MVLHGLSPLFMGVRLKCCAAFLSDYNICTLWKQFFNILQSAHKAIQSEWLTVDDIAAELKISKSVVYQLIRNGELDAVNLDPNAGKILKKGHYRIQRESLNNYLQVKRVFSLPGKFISRCQSQRLPQIKIHLGL